MLHVARGATTVSLVGVTENCAWFRICMPKHMHEEAEADGEADGEEQGAPTLEWEPVIVTWLVVQEQNGERVSSGDLDVATVKRNRCFSAEEQLREPSMRGCNEFTSISRMTSRSGNNHNEWIVQCIGLYANTAYSASIEVVACCVSEGGSRGNTRRIRVPAVSFCTLRQPVVLRVVWRQCRSAVVFVTRQFPGKEEPEPGAVPNLTMGAILKNERPKQQWLPGETAAAIEFAADKRNAGRRNNIDGTSSVEAASSASPSASPFTPPWRAQVEVYDAANRQLVTTVVGDARERHMLLSNLHVSHPFTVRVRAIYENITPIGSSASSEEQQSEQEQKHIFTSWYGTWSVFGMFRTRGPFLVRAVKTSVRFAHLTVPDVSNERYERVPPHSLLDTLPPLHPSFGKAQWLPCVGSVAKPMIVLSGKMAGLKAGEIVCARSGSDENDDDAEEEDELNMVSLNDEDVALLTAAQQEEHSFRFDNESELDEPASILGLQPDTEYVARARLRCAMPPFPAQTVFESVVHFRTQPKIFDGSTAFGDPLMSHVTGTVDGSGGHGDSRSSNGGGGKLGSPGGKRPAKPAVPLEATPMDVETAVSLLATETSVKIGWTLRSRSFEESMKTVSAYEPRFYLVRFAYLRRGMYRLTDIDRNIIRGRTTVSRDADWETVISNTSRAVKHALSSVVWKGAPKFVEPAVLAQDDNMCVQYTQDAIIFSADRTVLLEQLEPDRRICVHVRAVDMNPLYLVSVWRPGALFSDIVENSLPEFGRDILPSLDRPAFTCETNITAFVTLKPPELDVREYEVGSELRGEGSLTVQLRPGIIEQERGTWRRGQSEVQARLAAVRAKRHAHWKRQLDQRREEARKKKHEGELAAQQKKETRRRKSLALLIGGGGGITDSLRSSKPPTEQSNKKKKKKKRIKSASTETGDEEGSETAAVAANATDQQEEGDGEEHEEEEEEEQFVDEDADSYTLVVQEEEPPEFQAHAWYHAQNTLSYEVVYAERLDHVVRTCQVDRAPLPPGLAGDSQDPRDHPKRFVLQQIGRGAFRFIPRLSQGDGSFGRRGQNLDIIVKNVAISSIENVGDRGLQVHLNPNDLRTDTASNSVAGRVPVVSGAGMLTATYMPFDESMSDEFTRKKNAARATLAVPPDTVVTGAIHLGPLLPGQYDIVITLCIAGYVVAQEGSGARAAEVIAGHHHHHHHQQQQRKDGDDGNDEEEADDSKKERAAAAVASFPAVSTGAVTTGFTYGSSYPPFCLPMCKEYDQLPCRGTVLRHFQLVPLMVCEHFVMLTVMATRELPTDPLTVSRPAVTSAALAAHSRTLQQASSFSSSLSDSHLHHHAPPHVVSYTGLQGFLECVSAVEAEPLLANRGVLPPAVWEAAHQQHHISKTRSFDDMTPVQQRRLGFLRRIFHQWLRGVATAFGGAGGDSGLNEEDLEAVSQFESHQSRFVTAPARQHEAVVAGAGAADQNEDDGLLRSAEQRLQYVDYMRQDCFEIEVEVAPQKTSRKHAMALSRLKQLQGQNQQNQQQQVSQKDVLKLQEEIDALEAQLVHETQTIVWTKSRTNKRPCEVLAIPLTPNVLYDFRFRLRPVDQRQEWGSWSAVETFGTAAPWKLECNAVTEQSATVQWRHLAKEETMVLLGGGAAAAPAASSNSVSLFGGSKSKQQQQQQDQLEAAAAEAAAVPPPVVRPIVLRWAAGRVDMVKAVLAAKMEMHEAELSVVGDEDAGELYSIALSDVVMEIEVNLVITPEIIVPCTFVVPGAVTNVIIRGLEPGCDYTCRVRQTLPDMGSVSSSAKTAGAGPNSNMSNTLSLGSDSGWSSALKIHTLHNIRATVESYGAHHCSVLIKQQERKFYIPDFRIVKNASKTVIAAVTAARDAFATGDMIGSMHQDRGMLQGYETAIHTVRFERLNRGSGALPPVGGGGRAAARDDTSLDSSFIGTVHLAAKASVAAGSGGERETTDDGGGSSTVSGSARRQQHVLRSIEDVRDLAIPPEDRALVRKMATWSKNDDNTAQAEFESLEAGVCYQVLGRTVLRNGEKGQWTRLCVITTYPLADVHLCHVTQDAAVFVWTVPATDGHINEANAPPMRIEAVEVKVEGRMLPSVYRSPIESFERVASELPRTFRCHMFPVGRRAITTPTTAALQSQRALLAEPSTDFFNVAGGAAASSMNSASSSTNPARSMIDMAGSSRQQQVPTSKKQQQQQQKQLLVVLRSVVVSDLVPNNVYVARVRFQDNWGKWSRFGRLPIRFRTLPMVRCSALCVGDDFAILAATHDRWYERSTATESVGQDQFIKNASSSHFDFGDDDEEDDLGTSAGVAAVAAGSEEEIPVIEAIPFLQREDELEWTMCVVPANVIELVASSRDAVLRWEPEHEHTDLTTLSYGTRMAESLRGHSSYVVICRARYRDANVCPIDSLKRRGFETGADVRVRSAVATFPKEDVHQLRKDLATVLSSVWSDVMTFRTTPPVKLRVVRLTHTSVIVDARRYASSTSSSSGAASSSSSAAAAAASAKASTSGSLSPLEDAKADSTLKSHCGALFVASKCLVSLEGRSKVHELNLPLASKKGAAILIIGFSTDEGSSATMQCRRLDVSVQCTTTEVSEAIAREAPAAIAQSAFRVTLPDDVVLRGKSSYIDDLGCLPRRPSMPILYERQVPDARARRAGGAEQGVAQSLLLWWGTPPSNEEMWPGVPASVGDDEWPDRLKEHQVSCISMIEDGYGTENDERDKEIADFIDREYDMMSVLVIDLVDQAMLNSMISRRRSSAAAALASRRGSSVLLDTGDGKGGGRKGEIKGVSRKFEVEIAHVDPLLKVRSAFVPLAVVSGDRPYLRVLLDERAPQLKQIMFRVRTAITVRSCGLSTELFSFYSAAAAWLPPHAPPPVRRMRILQSRRHSTASSIVLAFEPHPRLQEAFNQPRFEISFPGESEHVLVVSHSPVLISRLRTLKTYTIAVTTVTTFGRSEVVRTIKWRSPSTDILPQSANLFPSVTQLEKEDVTDNDDDDHSRDFDDDEGDQGETNLAITGGAFTRSNNHDQENRQPMQAVRPPSRSEKKQPLQRRMSWSANSTIMNSFSGGGKRGASAAAGSRRSSSATTQATSATAAAAAAAAAATTRAQSASDANQFRWHWPFPLPVSEDAFPPFFGLGATSFHFSRDFEVRHERERRMQCGSDSVHVSTLPPLDYANKSVGRVFYADQKDDPAEKFVVKREQLEEQILGSDRRRASIPFGHEDAQKVAAVVDSARRRSSIPRPPHALPSLTSLTQPKKQLLPDTTGVDLAEFSRNLWSNHEAKRKEEKKQRAKQEEEEQRRFLEQQFAIAQRRAMGDSTTDTQRTSDDHIFFGGAMPATRADVADPFAAIPKLTTIPSRGGGQENDDDTGSEGQTPTPYDRNHALNSMRRMSLARSSSQVVFMPTPPQAANDRRRCSATSSTTSKKEQ